VTRALHLINALLALGLVGFSAWAWPHLPERIPLHFDASGEPTRWGATSFWTWFTLPLLALAMVGLNYGIAAAMSRFPQMVNLPGRRRLTDLPPERRQRVLVPMRDMVYALSAPLLLVFWLIQIGSFSEARGYGSAGFIVVALLLAVSIAPFLLVGFLPRIQETHNREMRAEEEGDT
jgi:uncharacterized membrane protein